jgi:NADH dehydrogenase/NADH:ubiquinone oxidoreductase subunit G
MGERLVLSGAYRSCLVSVKIWVRQVAACATALVDGTTIEATLRVRCVRE